MIGDIERLTEHGVQFLEESDVNEVDLIVLATGYQIDFPFLSDDLRACVSRKEDNSVNLYKYVFPLIECDHQYCNASGNENTTDNELFSENSNAAIVDENCNNMNKCSETLGFIGIPNALGPLFPIAEIQSRWFVQVMVRLSAVLM